MKFMLEMNALLSYAIWFIAVCSVSGFQSSQGSRVFSNPEFQATRTRLFGSKHYDLAVIGGGVVGVQAALAAASAPFSKKVCLIDAPREGSMIIDEDGEDLSIGAPTGLFGKALRDVSKRIKVSTLRGMGLREDR